MYSKQVARQLGEMIDPVAAFCRDLRLPLEIIANLLFAASRDDIDSEYAQHLTQSAYARIDSIRKIISRHSEG